MEEGVLAGVDVVRVFVSVECMVCGQGYVVVGTFLGLLHLLALWPFFWQWKQSPSLIYLAHSIGVNLESEIALMSMAFGS